MSSSEGPPPNGPARRLTVEEIRARLHEVSDLPPEPGSGGEAQPDRRATATAVDEGHAVSAADLLEPGPRTWLVAGIIPDRWPTILYGDGGVGKTTLSNHLACCVALGLPWFGRETTVRNVLVVDAEMDQDEFAARVWPIARGMGLKAPPRNVYYWNLPGPLGDDDVLEQLFGEVTSTQAGLIIVDSLTLATHSSDQFIANDLSTVVFKITKWRIATLYLDHHARIRGGDGDSRVDPYGTVMKRNLARSSVYLQAAGPGLVRLTPNKVTFAAQWEPFSTEVRFEGEHPGQTITYHPVATNDPRLAQAATRTVDDEIMDTIQDLMEGEPDEYGGGVNVPTITKSIQRTVKSMNPDAVRMRCIRMAKDHRLVRPATGLYAIPYLLRTPPNEPNGGG